MRQWVPVFLLTLFVSGLPLEAVAFEADWYQPGVQEAKHQYIAAREKADAERVQTLTAYLSGRILKANEEEEAARKVRNVKNLMTAKKSRALHEEILSALRADGDFTCPEEIRKDLQEQLDELIKVKQEADQRMKDALQPLRHQMVGLIKQQAAAAGVSLSGEEQDALFEVALASPDEAPAAAEASLEEVTETDEPEAPKTEVFGVSAEDYDGPWMEIGRWTGDIQGMLILDLRVCDRDTDWVDSQMDMRTGLVSEFRYEPAFTLPSGNDYVWRLTSIEGRSGVDVLLWPTDQNKNILQFRTRRASVYPAQQGFVLEAACRGKDITKLAGTLKQVRTPVAKKTRIQMVEVAVHTEPEGAYVLVDGEKAKDRFGAVFQSPGKVLMEPGVHEVTLQLKHFEDKTASAFKAFRGASIKWRFSPSQDLDWREFEIEADKDWKKTSVEVWDGQQFLVQAAGQWVCGSRGDLCGPQGYTPTHQPHYYSGGSVLKKHQESNYGALLMRIGEIGETNYYGDKILWKAGWDDQGAIYFDVNEADDKELRRGNRGQLKVRIAVLPDD